MTPPTSGQFSDVPESEEGVTPTPPRSANGVNSAPAGDSVTDSSYIGLDQGDPVELIGAASLRRAAPWTSREVVEGLVGESGSSSGGSSGRSGFYQVNKDLESSSEEEHWVTAVMADCSDSDPSFYSTGERDEVTEDAADGENTVEDHPNQFPDEADGDPGDDQGALAEDNTTPDDDREDPADDDPGDEERPPQVFVVEAEAGPGHVPADVVGRLWNSLIDYLVREAASVVEHLQPLATSVRARLRQMMGTTITLTAVMLRRPVQAVFMIVLVSVFRPYFSGKYPL